jgi:hypothetical protein
MPHQSVTRHLGSKIFSPCFGGRGEGFNQGGQPISWQKRDLSNSMARFAEGRQQFETNDLLFSVESSIGVRARGDERAITALPDPEDVGAETHSLGNEFHGKAGA